MRYFYFAKVIWLKSNFLLSVKKWGFVLKLYLEKLQCLDSYRYSVNTKTMDIKSHVFLLY